MLYNCYIKILDMLFKLNGDNTITSGAGNAQQELWLGPGVDWLINMFVLQTISRHILPESC